MEHEWAEAHRVYLASLRAWEARKLASKVAHEDFAKKSASWDTVEAPPAFTEPAPIAPAHPEYPTNYWDQITKDVDRSLWKQCPDEADRNEKRAMLHRMISAVLIKVKDDEGKQLHYFQGYHDLAGVCLLTCGEQIGYSVLKRLSTTFLRDQMQEKIDHVTSLMLALFPLVSKIDPKIGQVLKKSGVQPFAALPWVMTWFSHVLEDEQLSERFFDFFLASPPWMPLYLAASVIVFMGDNGLYSCPCEFSEVHNFVSRFCSKASLPWNRLISDSLSNYTNFPPDSFNAASYLPADSYLLKYPYSWVPANEVLSRQQHIVATIALASATAVVVVGVGIGFAYMSSFSHIWGEQVLALLK